MKASVIVPVLYEEPLLGSTLERLARVRDRVDLEVLVVVDVPDPARAPAVRAATEAVTEAAGATVLYRVGERGFGSALRHGFAHAAGDVMIPLMGDVSDDPETIPAMLTAIERGADVVAGSRYVRGGGIVGKTAKQSMSRIYSQMIRAAGGPRIHDVSNAFKAYRREVVEQVRTVGESFDVSVELTVKAALAGFRVTEVPTVWTNREVGTSNFHFGQELSRYGRWLRLVAASRIRGRRGTPARPS